MEMLNKLFSAQLLKLKQNGFLSVLFALLCEAIFIGFLTFIALFTIETLLPTFVTVRFSLTQFLIVLILSSFLLGLLGRYLGLRFSLSLPRKKFWLVLGLTWTSFILLISLFKFPLVFIPVIIFGFFFSFFLASKIFLEE